MKFIIVMLFKITMLLTVLVNINCFDFDENQSKLLQQFPTDSNLTIDDAKLLLQEKCRKVSQTEEAFEEIVKGSQYLMECITELINITAVKSEIEIARPKGELDAVFNKYCQKRTNVMTCVQSFKTKLDSCLEDDEKKNSVVFLNIIQSLLNFVCFKGGDQIALFIAEKGPECLELNKDVISNCVNTTFFDYMPTNLTKESLSSLPQFVIGPKQCGELQNLEECIVLALEKCEEMTPANIVESMFRFIKNETMCQPTPRAATRDSGAENVIFSKNWMSIFISLSIMLLLKVK